MSESAQIQIERLTSLAGDRDALCGLLVDCVASGASVGFLPPVARAEAERYWSGVERDVLDGSRLLLVARAGAQLAGAVQLSLCGKKNGLHRAEVEKLMVHTAHRGAGLGRLLLAALEAQARQAGRTLLVLDTRTGDVASTLYRKTGYLECGHIPGFALSATGELDGTTFFYKQL